MKYLLLAPSRTPVQQELTDDDNNLYDIDTALHRYLTTASSLKDTTFVMAPAGDGYSLSLEDLANNTFNDEMPSYNNSEFRKIDALKHYIEAKGGKLDVVLTFDAHNPDHLIYDKILEHHKLSRLESRKIGRPQFIAQLAEHVGAPDSKYDTADDFGYASQQLCDQMENLDEVEECSSSTVRSIRIMMRYLEHKKQSKQTVNDDFFIFCYNNTFLTALDSVNLISIPEISHASQAFKMVSEATNHGQLFRNDIELLGIPNIKVLIRRDSCEDLPNKLLEIEKTSISLMMEYLNPKHINQHNSTVVGQFFKPTAEQNNDALDSSLSFVPTNY